MLTKIHIKYLYTASAVLLAYFAVTDTSPLLTFICAWTSLSLFLVGSAYWFNLASIFRKRQDGTIPWYIRWGFIPFLLGSRLYNHWARKYDSVPPMQRIDEHLYLGCRLFSADLEKIKANKITAILDVTAEFDGLDWSQFEDHIEYLNIPILDHSVPTSAQLNQAVNWLHRQVRANKQVLIHCAMGRGRSVLVLAAYLVCKDKQQHFAEVLQQIKQIRKTAGLNKWQLRALDRMLSQGKINIHKVAWIIANPVSGGGKWQEYSEQIQDELKAYFDLTLKLTTADETANVFAEQARNAGADIIIACGGDGTVTEVASQIVDTDIVLGIIPLGTTNALSHALFGLGSKLIPISQALDNIIQGHCQAIDTARCNEALVLLLVGIGFEQQMIESANRERKNALGQFAYLDGLWRAVNADITLTIQLSLDDAKPTTLTTHSLIVANAAPFTSVLAQGDGEPNMTDGLLDITWLDAGDEPKEQLLSLAELAIAGWVKEGNKNVRDQQASASKVHHAHAKKVTISSQPKCKYVIDGEVFEPADLTIEVQPASLKVFVPYQETTEQDE
ncbi:MULTISPECIES: diacylglycerol kinase family protein [unclassified Shewanella]|uniref:diacylglycerol kinase family protein n=1 Tax=unclassified Shewanella TaxID=196818 RepID=UPI0021DB69D6|nr:MULTISPECIES: diacylglycerol kinase family protein [unclassified Shewanella]MCU8032885.1 dual specificity protein phosphatase family protein [Shewanella sp. SM71]MCU8081581.1 dual specificity protein phosphatase family protein [Shewanella sp. SM23]MCU8094771.1 dual specificity protein phosphatase family protein [Shewanella sp. SM102]